MIGAQRRWVWLAVLGIAWITSCKEGDDAKIGAFGISNPKLVVGATPVDPVGAGGTGGTQSLSLAAPLVELSFDVEAPVGKWNVVVSAQGALAVVNAAGGTTSANSTRSFSSSDPRNTTPLSVSLKTVAPGGAGIVSIELESARESYTFQVDPLKPTIDICPLARPGSCQPSGFEAGGTGGGGGGGVGQGGSVSMDGKTRTLDLSASSPDTLHDGDQFILRVSLGEYAGAGGNDAVSWTGTISTEGVLALGAPGATSSSKTITFSKPSGSVLLPGLVQGVGVGVVRAAIGSGPETTISPVVTSALHAVRQVHFEDYVGLGARNRLLLCSTRSDGDLHVAAIGEASDAAITPSEVALSAPSPECPPGYPGHASVLWTGFDETAYLEISTVAAKAPLVDAVGTLGTTRAVYVDPEPAEAVCEGGETLGGGGAGGGGGEGGEGLGTGCPGASTQFITLHVERDDLTGTDKVAAAGVHVAVALAGPVELLDKALVTDAAGDVLLRLKLSRPMDSIPALVTIDQRVTKRLSLRTSY